MQTWGESLSFNTLCSGGIETSLLECRHGGLSTVMKLTKLFAEAGAAAIHFEDQLVGGKKVSISLRPPRSTLLI